MNRYLFNKNEYYQFYRCDYFNATEWAKYGEKRPIWGIAWLLTGVVLNAAYIPCLVAMLNRNLFKYSCFKIMFFIGVLDVIDTIFCCFMSGYMMTIGDVFCLNPDLHYITASLAIGVWCGKCLCAVLLAFNRLLNIWSKRLSEALFEGQRTYFWFVLSGCYMFYFTAFTKGGGFSSAGATWLFDPYIMIPTDVVEIDRSFYVNIPYTASNLVILSVLVVFYVSLLVSVHLKTSSTTQNNWELRVMWQALLVILLVFIPDALFNYAEYFPIAEWYGFTIMITWQMSNGGGFIYLCMNRTIRRNVADLIWKKKKIGVTSVSQRR